MMTTAHSVLPSGLPDPVRSTLSNAMPKGIRLLRRLLAWVDRHPVWAWSTSIAGALILLWLAQFWWLIIPLVAANVAVWTLAKRPTRRL
jgi:hypothetical protein